MDPPKWQEAFLAQRRSYYLCVSLEFTDANAKWDAKGTVYVTNQRVVFLRIPPLPQPAEQSVASQHLRSLNVPLTHLVDSRYLIPIFGAPYYEASVLPVPGGNLPEGRPGGPASKGLCKIWFNEGGGAAFRDAVEEVRNLARGGQHGEQLRGYHELLERKLTVDQPVDTECTPSRCGHPHSTVPAPVCSRWLCSSQYRGHCQLFS